VERIKGYRIFLTNNKKRKPNAMESGIRTGLGRQDQLPFVLNYTHPNIHQAQNGQALEKETVKNGS